MLYPEVNGPISFSNLAATPDAPNVPLQLCCVRTMRREGNHTIRWKQPEIFEQDSENIKYIVSPHKDNLVAGMAYLLSKLFTRHAEGKPSPFLDHGGNFKTSTT